MIVGHFELNLGASGAVLGAFFAWKRCLSILGAVLDDVGSKVMFFGSFLDMEGEQQGQDGDMMAPRWVMKVPRWGMLAARWAF